MSMYTLNNSFAINIQNNFISSEFSFLTFFGSSLTCLENPRDGGAWWAAVYGAAQSRTWLKPLSSGSLHTVSQIRGSKQCDSMDYFLESDGSYKSFCTESGKWECVNSSQIKDPREVLLIHLFIQKSLLSTDQGLGRGGGQTVGKKESIILASWIHSKEKGKK